ncbi:hypothetical protein F4821DRAFT_96550 [Hypoxylon rubiginosum]|uniref:Uncharacterized protein n=1 Tax=Hypoxylon rubiginosum TaxID=110542 RepID=A0ACC0D5Z5_9PEZI|nr:hypothetical protein F4821DRAFT_96550 [Hypoxylon rubiginosum]
MQLADQKAPIFEAIILLALRQLESANTTARSSSIERCLAIRRKVKAELPHENSETAAIGEALLALEEFFRLAPAQWSGFQFLRLKDISPDLSLQHPTEPLKTIIRLQCRIVLATSILTRKRPPSYVKSHLASINQYTQSPSIVLLDGCLFHLADCLLMNTDIEVVPRSAEIWLHLWTQCQQWYEGRLPWAQPILDIRPLEARQIDTETFSSFPIQIYTTTIALLSNAVYHITSLLLLSRKPRLPAVSAQDRHLASSTWHAQKIAGIATRNNFKDQWDPILIAGLLLVSGDMTNKAQQDTLLECFGKMSDATGIRLDRETGELRSHWAILRGGN